MIVQSFLLIYFFLILKIVTSGFDYVCFLTFFFCVIFSVSPHNLYIFLVKKKVSKKLKFWITEGIIETIIPTKYKSNNGRCICNRCSKFGTRDGRLRVSRIVQAGDGEGLR